MQTYDNSNKEEYTVSSSQLHGSFDDDLHTWINLYRMVVLYEAVVNN